MNAKKVAVALSALVLGLTSCGQNAKSLTRKEAEEHLDAIVAATPAAQTKLSASNTNTDPKATISTYNFDGAANYSHVKFEAAKKLGDVTVNELFAYLDGANFVFGFDGISNNEQQQWSVTLPSGNAAVAAIMAGFAQKQIDGFIKCGREHWHNGAGGLSAYLKRQDVIDQNKTPITVSDQTIEAGATEKDSYIVLADEKYSTTGEGNLTLDFDALYPNPEHPEKLHEPLLFEFNNNLLTHWYNKKASSYHGNEWTMNYGTVDVAKTTFEAASDSDADAVVKATQVVTLLSAAVSADQPYDEASLYPAHWAAN